MLLHVPLCEGQRFRGGALFLTAVNGGFQVSAGIKLEVVGSESVLPDRFDPQRHGGQLYTAFTSSQKLKGTMFPIFISTKDITASRADGLRYFYLLEYGG